LIFFIFDEGSDASWTLKKDSRGLLDRAKQSRRSEKGATQGERDTTNNNEPQRTSRSSLSFPFFSSLAILISPFLHRFENITTARSLSLYLFYWYAITEQRKGQKLLLLPMRFMQTDVCLFYWLGRREKISGFPLYSPPHLRGKVAQSDALVTSRGTKRKKQERGSSSPRKRTKRTVMETRKKRGFFFDLCPGAKKRDKSLPMQQQTAKKREKKGKPTLPPLPSSSSPHLSQGKRKVKKCDKGKICQKECGGQGGVFEFLKTLRAAKKCFKKSNPP